MPSIGSLRREVFELLRQILPDEQKAAQTRQLRRRVDSSFLMKSSAVRWECQYRKRGNGKIVPRSAIKKNQSEPWGETLSVRPASCLRRLSAPHQSGNAAVIATLRTELVNVPAVALGSWPITSQWTEEEQQIDSATFAPAGRSPAGALPP